MSCCSGVWHLKEVGVQRTDEREKPLQVPGDKGWSQRGSEWTLTSKEKVSGESENDDGDHRKKQATYHGKPPRGSSVYLPTISKTD